MKIIMSGIEFSQANLSRREVFAFTKNQAQSAMQTVKNVFGINSCVIISTCNRTEIWICDDDRQIDLRHVLCSLKKVSLKEYESFFVTREGIEAVRHLFETACGLRSQIMGEDQILTQIKHSIELARKANMTNEVMEKLFQVAITSAKKIKSTVKLTACDQSIATKTIEIINNHFPTLPGLKFLVIGNGEMGRMVSSMLADFDARVTVTLREYKHGLSPVPAGCAAVNYENRIPEIKHSDLIISATSSPHFTVKYEDVCDILADKKPRFFIDLAVPRDIDPQISKYANVVLLDIESLGVVNRTKANIKAILKAQAIIEDYLIEFIKWSIIREVLPLINSTVGTPADLIDRKLEQQLESFQYEGEKGSLLKTKVITVTTKTIRQLLKNSGQEFLIQHSTNLGFTT